jgi:hypothetical protein
VVSKDNVLSGHGLHKIQHVINIIPAADYDSATRQYRGPAVGVQVDKVKNVGKVERALPSKLDGLPVIVMPPVNNAHE